jgi:hypothetical protein
MVIHKTSEIPDLFGNTKHTYQTQDFESWITQTKDGKFFITVFNKYSNYAVTIVDDNNETKFFNNFNIAYLQMAEKMAQIRKGINFEKHDNKRESD